MTDGRTVRLGDKLSEARSTLASVRDDAPEKLRKVLQEILQVRGVAFVAVANALESLACSRESRRKIAGDFPSKHLFISVPLALPVYENIVIPGLLNPSPRCGAN